MANLERLPAGVLSVIGAVGDVAYRVRPTGAWEVYPRGRPDIVLHGEVSESFQAGRDKARRRAQLTDRKKIDDIA